MSNPKIPKNEREPVTPKINVFSSSQVVIEGPKLPNIINAIKTPRSEQGNQKRSNSTPRNSPRYMESIGTLMNTPSILSFIQEHELNLKLTPKTDEVPYEEPNDVREKVYNFVRVPVEVEKFLFFGFFLCLDSFLFYLTMLPLRILIAFFLLIFRRKSFNATHAIDIFKGITLAINCILLYKFSSYGSAYHWVRGESAIKLYVIYNILEVFERLASSFGQDIMQSLYFSIKENNSSNYGKIFHIISTLCITIVYLFLHTTVEFYRIVTLNVALNSQYNALLVLLVSNNFVELKSNVFKRIPKDQLFIIACKDIQDRFEIFFYAIVISIQNMRNAVFGMQEIYSIILVMVAEIITDAMKHAFISKYNEIGWEIYGKFRLILCSDLTKNTLKNNFLDTTSVVSHRIQNVPIPMISFFIVRILFKIQTVPTTFSSAIVWILGISCLFGFKLLLSLVISGYSGRKTLNADEKDVG